MERFFLWRKLYLESPEIGVHEGKPVNFHQGVPDCTTLGLVSSLAGRGRAVLHWDWPVLPKCIQEKGCRTLSLGSDLRQCGDVSELGFHHLRVFQLLPRSLAWESSGESLLCSRTVKTGSKGPGKGGTGYTFHGHKCCDWRDPTRNSPGNPWVCSQEKESTLNICQAQMFRECKTI